MARSVVLDDELERELESVASDEGRAPADVVRDALRAYVERRRYLAAIDEGIRAADAGEVVDGEEVERWLDTW